MFQRPTALEFLGKFIEAYKQSVMNFSAEQLRQVWDSHWNGLIIGGPSSPPAPLDRPVWEMTAQSLGLKYWEGEPLRLDGVFYVEGDRDQIRPFPIRVALEHEYVPANFSQEIVKLLSVRCPLKVGIIYYDRGDRSQRLRTTEDEIRRYFKEFSMILSEDAVAEYLFISGLVQRQPFQIDWQSLRFSAADCPQDSHFVPV